MDDQIRKSLEETLDEAEWSWLQSHAERDALILVEKGLDLLTVAEKIARDDQQAVAAWISAQALKKPTALQLKAWAERPGKKFLCVVVRPYVLAQEVDLGSIAIH